MHRTPLPVLALSRTIQDCRQELVDVDTFVVVVVWKAIALLRLVVVWYRDLTVDCNNG